MGEVSLSDERKQVDVNLAATEAQKVASEKLPQNRVEEAVAVAIGVASAEKATRRNLTGSVWGRD